MAIKDDSQYPVLTGLINEVQDLKDKVNPMAVSTQLIADLSDKVDEGNTTKDALENVIKTANTTTYATKGDVNTINSALADIAPYNINREVVFGQEYLSAFHKKVMVGNTTTIVFSGDSTTKGDATTSPYRLNEIFKTLCDNAQIPVTTINHGHSGAWTTAWNTTYANDDLASNPDLLIVRWGLNDANLALNIGSYESALRGGLQK
jgi:hypothetical protein